MVKRQRLPLIISVFLVSLMLSLIACGQNTYEEKYDEKTSFIKGDYNIVFSLPGDDFASVADRALLHKLQEKIVRLGVGRPVSVGSGMGNMFLVLNIDSAESLRAIKDIINDIYPEAQYKILPAAPR